MSAWRIVRLTFRAYFCRSKLDRVCAGIEILEILGYWDDKETRGAR